MRKLYGVLLLLSVLTQSARAQWQAIYPVDIAANGVFFTSAQTGYIVGSRGGHGTVIKTTTAGENWEQLSTPAYSSLMKSVWFTAADTGYILTEGSVLRTRNAGATWADLGSNFLNQPQGIQFTTATTGYVNFLNGAVYKTTDAGLTWQDTQVPAASASSYGNDSRLVFPTAQVGYLVAGVELFKTSNAGASWQRLTGVAGRRYRALMFRSATEGYVTTDSGGTYRTTDGGATWTALTAGYDASLAYFRDSQQGLLFSNYSRISATTDGGSTARPAYSSRYTFSWTGIHFPTATFGCAVGHDGAIVITQDGGKTWRMQNPSTTNLRPNYALFFGRNGQGLIGGEAAGLWRTANAGRSWQIDEQALPPYTSVYGLHFADADTGLVVTTNNYFYPTHDGGKTFLTTTARPGAFVGHQSATDYLLLSSNVIFTTGSSVGSNARLAKSVNGGKTWTYYSPGFQNRLTSLSFPTSQVGYACGAVGKVVRTTNGGTTWQEIDAPVNNDLLKIKFRTPAFGLAVGTYGSIVRTTDGGTTWTSIPSGLSFPLIAVHFQSDSVAYVGSSVGELARTTNGGRTWQVLTPPAERLPDIRKYYFRDAGTVLAMGAYGVYQYDLSTVLSTRASVAERVLGLFPNPASEAIEVQYPAGFVPVRLLVYDLRGRVVLEQRRAESGPLRAFSVAGLPAGLYVLRVESQQQSPLTRRFIKQ